MSRCWLSQQVASGFDRFRASTRKGYVELRVLSVDVQGRLSIPFKEIERNKRIKDNFSLHGVRRGQLTVSCSWLGISDAK